MASLAAKGGLSQVLFRNLPIADPRLGIPREVASLWLREYLRNATRNNMLAGILAEILKAFGHRGIDVILLKGIHLMDALYCERPMRTIGDIDVLIHRENRAKATEVMRSLCYEAPSIYEPLPLAHSFHDTHIHPRTRVTVEVHYDLQDPGSPGLLDLAGLWQRSLVVPFGGLSARALAPDDLLLYLCVHFSNHILSVSPFPLFLRSLYDIALLIRRQAGRINWDVVSRALKHGRGKDSFALPLLMAETLLHVQLPLESRGLMHPATAITPQDLCLLKKHLFLSLEQRELDARFPLLIRAAMMEKGAGICKGILRTLFFPRAELARRYGVCATWYCTFGKYVLHYFLSLKKWCDPRKFRLGGEVLGLSRHFAELASLRERVRSLG